MTIIWLIAFLGLLVLELLTVGLVSIWFAFGAVAALLVSFFTESIMIQAIVFVFVSVLALIVTRPLLKKFRIVKIEPTNLVWVVGKEALVISDILPSKYGEVEVLGNVWSAVSDDKIIAGSKVVVEKIDGSKLIVKEKGE